ncbi:MAG: glycosyltransferase family 39 protein [Actinobacteria bacterium]|nr:glycosyltransferase family 39 protein [Actinomycetota bacterium]
MRVSPWQAVLAAVASVLIGRRGVTLGGAAAWGLWSALVWHGRTGFPPSGAFVLTWLIWGAVAGLGLTIGRRAAVAEGRIHPLDARAAALLGATSLGLALALYVSDGFNHAMTAATAGSRSWAPGLFGVPILAVAGLAIVRCVLAFARAREARLVPALGAVAFALSAASANWGLPALYHPDETIWLWIAVKSVATADLNPDFFHNPSLYPYLIAALVAPYYWLARWLGVFAGPDDLQALFAFAPDRFVVAARLLNAGLAAVLVALTYALARRFLSPRMSLLAAALVAVAFLVTRAAHHATTDVLAAVLATGVLLLAVEAHRRPAWRMVVGGATVLGLAIGAKYNAALAAAPLAAVVVRRWQALPNAWGGKLARAAAAAVTVALAFLLTTPFAVLDWESFSLHLLLQAEETGVIAWGQAPDPVAWLAALALVQGMGWAAVLLAVPGAVRSLRRPGGWVLFVYAALTVVSVVIAPQFRVRFLLPLAPLIAIWAADTFDLARRWSQPWWRFGPTPTILAALVVAQPLVTSVWHNIVIAQTDTRELARQWVRASIPDRFTVGVDAFSILDTRLNVWDQDTPDGARQLHRTVQVSDWKDKTVQTVRNRGPSYAVVSSYVYERYVRSGWRPDWPPFYRELQGSAEELARFAPGPGGSNVPFDQEEVYTPFWHVFDRDRPGPTITIYRLP